MIFLLTATMTSYAGIYRDNTPDNSGSSGYGALFGNSNSSNPGGDSDSGGLFRSSNVDPGDRPGNGDGIGQQAPIGNGVRTLAVCCLIYGIVKLSSKKRNNNNL